ncbi:MAG: hypothetical protein MUE33_12280 [Cytophagaceae bacterium]|jgi:DNA-binding NtrC family response regulator|nr:hypothetical protein [Cytophagaceae bacterium]
MKYAILIVGKNQSITSVLQRLFQQKTMTVVVTTDEMKYALQWIEEQQSPFVVVSSSGMLQEEERSIKQKVLEHKGKYIEHFGGGSGLLEAEWQTILLS